MFSAMLVELYAIAFVAAVPKYCPPATADVDTAVINPLPLTVITGIELELPKAPVLLLTVARVALVIAVPVLPDRVKSPPVTEIDPDTVAVETAVIKPLPFTVITGTDVVEPNEPVLEFTVASVRVLLPAELEASPTSAGSLAAANVPLEILVAFKDVNDAPEPLGLNTSVPIVRPKLVLAVDAEVRSLRLLAFSALSVFRLVKLASTST
jgi:hypothetical protein